MPYKIVEISPGKFKVQSKDSGVFLSKRGLSYKRALAQHRAVTIQELKGGGFFSNVLQKARNTFANIFSMPKVSPIVQPITPQIAAPIQQGLPSTSTLQRMANAAYEKAPLHDIDGYTLVSQSPTLKFYKANKQIIVAIRGTADKADAFADLLVPLNNLDQSDRYKKDLDTLKKFQLTYPVSEYTYYGVGHSLGGALLDRFIKMGIIKEGVSFNPAIESENYSVNLPNKRIYFENDPLYKLFGVNVQNAEVRPAKQSAITNIISKVPVIGEKVSKLYDLYQAHSIDSFRGGKLVIEAKLNSV